jgi:hypothetical protein
MIMANVITNSQVSEIADPKLRKLLMRVVREMELGIDKVAANHAKPSEFLLPDDPNATERILAARYDVLPKAVKEQAWAKVSQRIATPAAARQRRFGDLAAVNLKVGTNIGAQVKALPLPADLKLTKEQFEKIIGTSTTVTTQPTLTKLEFRLHKVRCVDETGGFFGEKAGDDEIDLGGTAVDETGDTHVIPKFRVGSSFDDGEQVVFSPPRSFTVFDLREGTAFPKSYFVTLVLAEVDMGGLSDFLNKLVQKVKAKVIDILTKAVGVIIGSSGGPVGALVGIAVSFVVGKIFDLLVSIWSDDIFKPVTTSVKIASLNAQWPGGKTDSPEEIATFEGHGGKYQVTYDWRMFA